MSQTTKQTCIFCHLQRQTVRCGVCENPVCRSCALHVSRADFELFDELDATLLHPDYCPTCYDSTVALAKAQYDEIVERAKQVHYWPKSYRGAVPILKKSQVKLRVANVTDEKLALLKLAVEASRSGFNALIHGEISARKVRNHGYQKMLWSGSAMAATIDESKVYSFDE